MQPLSFIFLIIFSASSLNLAYFPYSNPHAATTINGVSYTYDNNGNLTSDGTWAHTWDYRNRLISSSSSLTYQYDHLNTRVKFVNTSSTVISPTMYYSTEGGTPVKYITALGQVLASVRGTGTSTTVYYMHNDHLGSVEKTTNASGTVAELSDYYPYGNTRLNNQTSVNDRKGYIGKDYDGDTGLTQAEARYYRSTIGRFISQDPVHLAIGNLEEIKQRTGKDLREYLSDPQQLNSYSYARNNPILYNVLPS